MYDYFKNMAAKHGNHVLSIIKGVLSDGDYPEIAYKRSMGIIQLHRAYGSNRLDNACKRALVAQTYSYNRIKNILKNNLDLDQEDSQAQATLFNSHIPIHENLRGASDYQ